MPTLNNLYPIFGCGQNTVAISDRESTSYLFDSLHIFLGIQQIFFDIEENLYLSIFYGSEGGAFISSKRISYLKHTNGNIPLSFCLSGIFFRSNIIIPFLYTNFKAQNGHCFEMSANRAGEFFAFDTASKLRFSQRVELVGLSINV